MTVRNPYERFLSGFSEVVRREPAWKKRWKSDPNGTLLSFMDVVEHDQRRWLAHVAPQYRFACKRPLDVIVHNLSALADMLQVQRCVSHLNKKTISEDALVKAAAPIQHRICAFTSVDSHCFFNETTGC